MIAVPMWYLLIAMAIGGTLVGVPAYWLIPRRICRLIEKSQADAASALRNSLTTHSGLMETDKRLAALTRRVDEMQQKCPVCQAAQDPSQK